MTNDWAIPTALRAPRAEPRTHGPVLSARWTANELRTVATHLEENGARALATLPLEKRVAAWTGAIDALLDPESEERRALLAPFVATSRLSPEGLTEALEIVLGGASGVVAARLAEEIGRREESPHTMAGVVLAANVPALAVQSLLPALLLGRPLFLRSSAREPLFAPALVSALSSREPALGEAFAAATWPSDDPDLLRAAFGRAERVLAYGDAAALAALGAHLGPRLTALGPRASVAFVAGTFDAEREGRLLARDVVLLDQRGCLSVQAVWVEGDARAFAEALAWGLALEAKRLPPGPIEPELASAVQQLRGEAELRGALVGKLSTREGSVLLAENADFVPVPGLRTVRVHEVAALDEALAALEPERGRLQGAALVGDAALAKGDEIAARLELARVARAGGLQHAESGWRSGGVDPLVVFG